MLQPLHWRDGQPVDFEKYTVQINHIPLLQFHLLVLLFNYLLIDNNTRRSIN